MARFLVKAIWKDDVPEVRPAAVMATLMRLPSEQRGGPTRVLGPDLRQTG